MAHARIKKTMPFTVGELHEVATALQSHARYFMHLYDHSPAPGAVKYWWLNHAERLLELADKALNHAATITPDPDAKA